MQAEDCKVSIAKKGFRCLLQTYNVDFQVPDSAGTATAFLSGVKTNMGVVGVTEDVKLGRCDDVTARTIVKSILRLSLDDGKPHNFVKSSQRVILYYSNRGWLGSRVVSVLDSGAEGPGFKSQPRRCRVTVLGELFTPVVTLFTKQQNW